MTLDKEPDPLRRIPTKHTTALRAEIGPILRAARLKRGQSLEAVAQQTRISKRFLEALEENRFEQFPAVVYLRGFLKGYCEYLDVNFDEVWALLNAEAAGVDSAATAAKSPVGGPVATTDSPTPQAASTPAPKTGGHAAKPAPPAAPIPAHGHAPAAHAPHAQAPEGSGATGAIALSVALALGLGMYLLKDHRKVEETPASVAPVALQPMPRAVEPKLVVRLKDDAWLRVSVDGQIVFEGRAPRDSVQEWKPSKFADLRTTDPAALEINLNGQPVTLGAPGPDGQYRVEIP